MLLQVLSQNAQSMKTLTR